ncbi:hypothetical protein GCM10009840_04080 [Pseudolysinimonas kribbensis]
MAAQAASFSRTTESPDDAASASTTAKVSHSSAFVVDDSTSLEVGPQVGTVADQVVAGGRFGVALGDQTQVEGDRPDELDVGPDQQIQGPELVSGSDREVLRPDRGGSVPPLHGFPADGIAVADHGG